MPLTMETLDILKFNDVTLFLKAFLRERQSSENGFSLRKWAQQLEVSSPGYLSNVICGKRPLTQVLQNKITEDLKFSEKERNYFMLLVDYQQEKNMTKKKIYANLLREINGEFKTENLSLDTFFVIQDWYHSAILEMTKLRGFKECGYYIASTLKSQINPTTALQALHRLKELKLLVYDKKKRLVVNRDTPLYVGNELHNVALRQHHKQYITQAQTALEREKTENRDIRGTVLAIKQKDFPNVLELIKKFHQDLHGYAADSNADLVTRINTQFFSLNTKPVKKEDNHEK